jgi:hypothetical protein
LVPNTPHPNPDQNRQLPNEIIDAILAILKADDNLPALAKVAQANRRMYSIAIPKLYKTVTITKRNKYQLWYGHGEGGMSSYNLPLFVLIKPDSSPSEQPTRKDIAASLTRKIILDDDSPKAIMVKGFCFVEEVVVSPQCLSRYMAAIATPRQRCGEMSAYRIMSGGASGLMQCLSTLASSRISSTPLHVTFVMDTTIHPYGLMKTLLREGALATVTFDFLDWPSRNGLWHLGAAYYAGGPVHFAPSLLEQDSLALDLAVGLERIFRHRGLVSPSSRIYLCNIPKLVLSPKELVAAGDTANHVAKLKIYKLCDFSNAGSDLTESQRWINFDAQVKFVEAGFRPSPADVAAIMEGR